VKSLYCPDPIMDFPKSCNTMHSGGDKHGDMVSPYHKRLFKSSADVSSQEMANKVEVLAFALFYPKSNLRVSAATGNLESC
jgi:hypothetical protein